MYFFTCIINEFEQTFKDLQAVDLAPKKIVDRVFHSVLFHSSLGDLVPLIGP